MRNMDEYRALPLARRLEIRGRLLFAEPMGDPNEATVAAQLARRQLRQTWYTVPLLVAALVIWRAITGAWPWGAVALWTIVIPASLVGLSRAVARNEASVAGRENDDVQADGG